MINKYTKALYWIYELATKQDIFWFALLVIGGLLAALLESLSILSIIPLANSLIGRDYNFNELLPQIKFLNLGIELNINTSHMYLWIFVSLFIMSSVYRLVLLWTQTIYIQRLSHIISRTVFETYINTRYQLVRDLSESEITSISINKCNEFTSTVIGTIFSVSNSLFFLLFVFYIFHSFDLVLVISTGILFITLYGGLFTLSNRVLNNYAGRISEYLTKLLNLIFEASRIRKEIELGRYNKYFTNRFKSTDKKIRAMRANVLILGVIPKYLAEITIVLIITVLLTQNKQYFVANFAIFGAAILAIHRLMPLLNQLYSTFTNFRASSVMVEEVMQFIKIRETAEIQSEIRLDLWKYIEVTDLRFSHKNRRGLTKKITTKLYRGKSYIVTGPSGSGKTTFLYCVAGIETQFTGRIYVGGSTPQKHNKLRYALATQLPFIHHGTVRENLLLDDCTASAREFQRVCRLLNIKSKSDSEIDNQLTLDTLCGENGMNLSGGQRQRVALARVLLQDFDVLLCDEALSAVEYSLEAKIIEGIIQLFGSGCLIYVSHRPELRRFFDKEINIQ